MDDPERIARDADACLQANNVSHSLREPFCPGVFDTWLCWPATPANATATAPCPEFVPGFSPELVAHKECMADGTWFVHPASNKSWSNYTTCVRADDDVSDIVRVYEAGYGVSLLALLLALLLLLRLRALRCARTTLHAHLFASFALNNALWLAWYGLVMRSPAVLSASPVWCRALQAATSYAMLTTYTWSLMEGAYLHTVLVHAFVSERKLLSALRVLGWLLPLPSAIWAAVHRALADEQLCWLEEGAPRPELALLAAGALLLNACFLINIVRVLCGKLRAPAAGRPATTALQALRATCLLAPLLGLHFLLLPFRPARDAPGWRAYELLAALVASLQGLAVAMLYCFFNGEVLAQLKRRWRTLTFRPRANSTTNTTVSFVRSAGDGDKA